MKSLTTFVFLLTLNVFAQKTSMPALMDNSGVFLETLSLSTHAQNITEQDLPEFIKGQAGFDKDITLSLSHKIASKALTHYHYNIYKQGSRIYAAQVHIALDHSGKIRLLEVPVLPDYVASGNFPDFGAAQTIQSEIGAQQIKATESVLVNNGTDYLQKALRVELAGPETLHQELVITASKILAQSDLLRYLKGPNDTSVSVKVFAPDPLTSAQKNYGAPYSDNNDQNSAELDLQLQTVNTIFSFENGEIVPKNDFVEVVDFSIPSVSPVSSDSSNQFYFTRDQDGFEDVNVMYHITQHKQHLVQLGYPGLPSYRIQVDPHALDNSDQSFFSTSFTPYRLYFGEGGVDDAEDADVIIHEFSHSVIFEASPSSVNTTERSCIEESLCDYFAASYSRSISNYHKDQVFNWDGHNEFWPGREVESNKTYGTVSFKNGNYYSHTDLFASPLMEIYGLIGRDATDQIVLEALFNLSPNTTMAQMAGYMILSDSLLNNGTHTNIIESAFVRRGILPTISVKEYTFSSSELMVLNTYEFLKGGSLSIVSQNKSLQKYELTNVNGQQIARGDLEGIEESSISSAKLKSGVYLLTIFANSGNSKSYKLLKI